MIKYLGILIFLVAFIFGGAGAKLTANENGILVAEPLTGEHCESEKCEHGDHSEHDHSGHDHSEQDSHCEPTNDCGHVTHGGHCDHSDDEGDHGHAGHDHLEHPWYDNGCNIYTLDDPNFGGFLFPSLSVFGAFGATSGDQEELAVGHHDPQTNATLQSIEPTIALQTGHLQGSATGSGYTDAHGNFSFVLEEGYLGLVDLPGGIGLRGGQFFNRFGFQSALHNHDWDFVDQNLMNGRFLNEGELSTQGGEIAVPIPWAESSRIVAAFGGVAVHGHHHHHDEEEEHSPFEAEGAEFRDQVFGVSWESELRFDDGRSLAGVVSGLWGDNAFGRQSQVYGAGVEYRVIDSGNSLRIRTEIMIRDVDAVAGHLPGESEEEEHGHEGDHGHEEDHDDDHDEGGGMYSDGDFASFDEFGLSSAILYSWNDRTELGLRADWVSGIDELGLDDRFRISPALTWYANPQRTMQCRIQYNHDIANDFGSENSIWFQVGFNWPGHHAH